MSWDILVSPIIDAIRHLTKSRVSLKIQGLWLNPHWYEDIKGYEDFRGYIGKVEVTNKGKKIAYNLTAEIGVDNGWAYVEVLDGRLMEKARKATEDMKIKIEHAHEDHARNVDYEWIDEKKESCGSVFKKLRQHDKAYLSFPRSHSVHVGWSDANIRSLRIVSGVEHRVVITVKAEDSEKNTVSTNRTFKFTVESDDDASSIYIS